MRSTLVGLVLLAVGCAHAPLLRMRRPQPHWIELTSRHFTLRTDLPRRQARAALADFEGVYGTLETVAFAGDAPRDRIDVVLFSDEERVPRAGAARRRRLLHAAAGGRSRSTADHRHPRAHADGRHARGRDDAAALSPRADPSLPRSSAALDAAVARGGAGRVLLDAQGRRAATPSSARCRIRQAVARRHPLDRDAGRERSSTIASTSPTCRRCSSS